MLVDARRTTPTPFEGRATLGDNDVASGYDRGFDAFVTAFIEPRDIAADSMTRTICWNYRAIE